MATFLAIILFGVSLHHYNNETISLEMLLLICALGLIVFAIDCRPTASSIEEALLKVFPRENPKETPSKTDEVEPIEDEFEDVDDIDEYPHLHF